tara:strand:- start:14110 stop:14352 length:243 start_codon:yes stop_codon:yes gene_type:complete
MMGACWHNNPIAGANFMCLAINDHTSFTILETKELIGVSVDLASDLFARRKRHQNQLQLGSRIENAPEVCVLFSEFFDIS